VTIEREATRAAVHLYVRYLPDRRLPDKVIDLLDEACATIAVRWTSVITGEEPMDTTPGLVTADTVDASSRSGQASRSRG
jgi:ATP-dependent Clp protease ATP-binding subunit ClpC